VPLLDSDDVGIDFYFGAVKSTQGYFRISYGHCLSFLPFFNKLISLLCVKLCKTYSVTPVQRMLNKACHTVFVRVDNDMVSNLYNAIACVDVQSCARFFIFICLPLCISSSKCPIICRVGGTTY